MRQLLRAASIGFGGTLGAGAAVVLGGALVAVLTRAAVTRTVSDGIDRFAEYLADLNSPDPVATQPLCGQSFPAGQGPCVQPAGHDKDVPHQSVLA